MQITLCYWLRKKQCYKAWLIQWLKLEDTVEWKWIWKKSDKNLKAITPVQIMIDQKQLENVEYFNYLGSMITNGARCKREIKSRIAMAKQLSTRKGSFYQQTGLKFEEETSRMLHFDYSFVWFWNLNSLESRSGIPGRFWNVVLEMDVDDELHLLCEIQRSVTKNQGGEECPTNR